MDLLSLLDFKTVLAFLATFLLCYLYLNRRKNLPPGPWSLPIIGNGVWFLRRASSPDKPAEMFLKASKTYGDLAYFKLGKQGLLVVQGCDAIQEVFVANAETFSDRPHWMSAALLKALQNGRGLMFESGDDFRKIRKFALQIMREFGVGKTTLEEKILVEVGVASDILTNHVQEPQLTRLMIANIIYGIVFGKRFDYDDVTFTELVNKIAFLFKQGGTLDMLNQLPKFILKIIASDRLKEMAKRAAVVEEIREHINAEIAEHEATYDPDNVRDFVDKYIESQRAEEDKHLFTAGNIYRLIMDLFIAGTDTTTHSIIWAVLYIVEHPQVQKRCQQEIQQKYGNKNILWSHRHELPYVGATLLEIQRMANVVEMSLPHTNEVDVTVRGYTIPKRTLVLGNLMSANMDPKHWQNPEQFNPERFLEDGALKKHPAFMPFSTGPRTCPGEALARMELFLVFTNFLQRFSFAREHPAAPISFAKDKSQLLSQPFPFKVRLSPRM